MRSRTWNCETIIPERLVQLWDPAGSSDLLEALPNSDQNEKIEQRITQHRNETDGKHRNLGETKPPENGFVAKSAEPQQFSHPMEDFEQDDDEDTGKHHQDPAGKGCAARGFCQGRCNVARKFQTFSHNMPCSSSASPDG